MQGASGVNGYGVEEIVVMVEMKVKVEKRCDCGNIRWMERTRSWI